MNIPFGRQPLLLRVSLYSGFVLLLLLGGLFAVVSSIGISGNAGRERGFSQLLNDYDFKYQRILNEGLYIVQPVTLDTLEQDLDQLEEKAAGVEAWLSILRRRRDIAVLDPAFGQSWLDSARRAAIAFPNSEPVAAVAAAALVHGTAITSDAAVELRGRLSLLESSRYTPIRLGLYALLGDFQNPRNAAAALSPNGGILPELWSPDFFPLEKLPQPERIAANLVILRILEGNTTAAAGDIETAMLTFPDSALVNLAAEFFYDFGDPLRAAKLFSQVEGEAAMSRQADSLWLAGHSDSARALWSLITSPEVIDIQSGDSVENSGRQSRALYNLALTAPAADEAKAAYERLIKEIDHNDDNRLFGLIRYSRLLDAPAAITALETETVPAGTESANVFSAAGHPAEYLTALEIVKRRTETAEPARTAAETWILLERFPRAEALYQWGAWYFDLQHNFSETAVLLKTAKRRQFAGNWLGLHEAIGLIDEGRLDEAETILSNIAVETTSWTAQANLGRILEQFQNPRRAVELYKRAATALLKTENPLVNIGTTQEKTVSRIQVCIARCLYILGQLDESREALQYALDLNPDNLNARFELDQLSLSIN